MKQAHARIAAIRLGKTEVGFLARYPDGQSVFVFADAYVDMGPQRPTLSLSFMVPGDEAQTVEKRLRRIYKSRQRLPSFFSNLLPEGALRALVSARLRVREDDEFAILLALGEDLPGNVRVTPTDDAPDKLLGARQGIVTHAAPVHDNDSIRFSLAGVQIKFSMLARGQRWTLAGPAELGTIIVKLPSAVHRDLPTTEYISMRLAQAAGVVIPNIQLLEQTDLYGLPAHNAPHERFAFAIDRFDRTGKGRVHIEDFAQILGFRPSEKYGDVNFDTMIRTVAAVFPEGTRQVEEFIRRLVVHILLGNADAHLKNWSAIFPDGINPQLAPAYDIVSTLPFAADRNLALNLVRTTHFYDIDLLLWQRLARRVRLDPNSVTKLVRQTVEAARTQWPAMLDALHAPDFLRASLTAHWQALPLWNLRG